jgi:hypothetical protein
MVSSVRSSGPSAKRLAVSLNRLLAPYRQRDRCLMFHGPCLPTYPNVQFPHKADIGTRRADGWARRVASLTAARCVQGPNSKPSVARMMNCAPIEATRNFHRTPAGNRAVGPSVDVCYERGPVSRFNKSRLFWPRWRHPLLQLGRSRPPKNRGGAFRFRCPRAAPPSATIRHLHDQRVRRQGDTL